MVEDTESKKSRLNFTRIYKINFNERDTESIQKLTDEFENLPTFRGMNDRNNKAKGFIPFEDDFDIKFQLEPLYEEGQNAEEWFIRDISISNGTLLAIRFRYEEFFEGKTEPQIREADLFWFKNFDILLIKGSEQACKKIQPYLTQFTSGGFEQISFDDEFLLWMSYRYQDDMKLSDNLEFIRMDKTRTQGTNTNDNDIRVREGQGRMIPIPTLYGLLNEQKLSHVGGDFRYKNDFIINAKLADDVSIFVYSTNALSGKSYSEKCELAFPFIIEIIDVFNKWDNRNSDDNKYPDDDFFDSTIRTFETEITYAIENLSNLKERYEELRNGSDEDAS